MDGETDRTGQTPHEQTPGAVGDPLPSENTDPPEPPSKSGLPWRLIALVAGASMAVGAAGGYAATLAATHNEAVRENLAAYLNGWHDALEAVQDGLDPSDLDRLDA